MKSDIPLQKQSLLIYLCINKVLGENVGCESLWYLVLMASIDLVTSPNMIIKFVHMLAPVELFTNC